MARLRLIDGYDHPALDPGRWDRVLASGSTDVVFLTLEWQREWWRAYEGDRLLLVAAEEAGELRAIAPLYANDDMLFLVGSGGSDYLDFIGDLDESTLATMLESACEALPDFGGLSLYHVPLASKTTALLPRVAERLGLGLQRDGKMLAPYLDLTDPERAKQAVERRKLRTEENRMRREGELRIRVAAAEDLDPWLESFFAQHTARWKQEEEAQFEDERHRAFCRGIVHAGHREGWLRFTMLEWKGQPAAFNIALVRGSRHLTYLVSRDPAIRGRSPGKLLDAYVIKQALDAGARCFDFGLGDEDYKLHHASGVAEVANWSLYP